MYFNYPSDILPFPLNKNIRVTGDLLPPADHEQKYGIYDLFKKVPFNIVNHQTFQEKLDDTCQQFIKASEKSPKARYDKERDAYQIEPWSDPTFGNNRMLLKDSFMFVPRSLFLKKGVSSDGKEILVESEDFPLPIFFFHTVYPLCWLVLREKNKFSITEHPLYPLFYRYLQEPLAVAMTLATADSAFAADEHAKNMIHRFVDDLSMNYRAGRFLYTCGLHLRWKDWRDGSKRCYGKFETIQEWIDMLSRYGGSPENDQIISIWARLFDLTAVEMRGLIAAAKYAPVISENTNLQKLVLGLLDYVCKNAKEFQDERIRQSPNPLAEVVAFLASGGKTIEMVLGRLPSISREDVIRDFIGTVLKGWSFSRDLHTDCFRIYGPPVMTLKQKTADENPGRE